MNEDRFVRFLKKKFSFRQGVGIGDDAAVIRGLNGTQLVTTDLLIEDTHFRLADMTPRELARKSLAVNLSDIAAMGGRPLHFYLGLGFPDRLGLDYLKRFFSGLAGGCKRWRVELAGGDYSRSRQLVIAITVIGCADRPVLRSGARPGDWLAVSGPTGESALGLRLLLAGVSGGYFVNRHKRVEPALEQGRTLARYASAMIDVSDGLLLDLRRILAASGVGAEVEAEALPVSARMEALCRRHGWNLRELQLTGGEDYVLLFTVSAKNELRLRKEPIDYFRIGRVTRSRRLVVRHRGRILSLPRLGFDHFLQAGKEEAE